jgi:hypothetical protein
VVNVKKTKAEDDEGNKEEDNLEGYFSLHLKFLFWGKLSCKSGFLRLLII